LGCDTTQHLLEKAAVLAGRGKRAGRRAANQVESPSGDPIVGSVAHANREQTADAPETPRHPQIGQQSEDGLRAHEHC
jgi:hypothetical protein